MKQITANVYVEDQFSVHPRDRGANPGFVTTSEGVVIIDPPFLPSDAVKWRDEISKKGEVRYIINTHHHPDHITGNFFFAGPVISHEEVRELTLAPLTTVYGFAGKRIQKAVESGQGTVGYIRLLIEERDPEGVPLMEGYQLKAPTITFWERLNLYVGGHTFELMHLPGHTQSHIGVYIPQERVFFGGDNFTYRTQPSLAHCLPLEWVESLKRIEAMDIDTVVPGHGEVCHQQDVREFRLFIQKCIDMVKGAIKQGMSGEEAADKISFAELHPGAKDGCPPVHLGPVIQRRNVLRLYEMLSKQGKKA